MTPTKAFDDYFMELVGRKIRSRLRSALLALDFIHEKITSIMNIENSKEYILILLYIERWLRSHIEILL